MGTVVYMAPEQARGRWSDVDGRTDSSPSAHDVQPDLRPLRARSGYAERTAPCSDVPSCHQSRERCTGRSTGLVEVVDRSLAYERDARYVDAAAMQNAVRLAYHGLLGKPITTAPRLLVPADAPFDPGDSAELHDGRAAASGPFEDDARSLPGTAPRERLRRRSWCRCARAHVPAHADTPRRPPPQRHRRLPMRRTRLRARRRAPRFPPWNQLALPRCCRPATCRRLSRSRPPEPRSRGGRSRKRPRREYATTQRPPRP